MRNHLKRVLRRRFAAAAALPALALASAGATAVSAATPGSGTISWSHPSLTWTGSNLAGSAPAFTRITCNTEVTACDNFSLAIDTTKNGAVDHHAEVSLTLTPSSGQQMYLIVYPPGSDPTDVKNSTYSKFGLHWTAFDPPNGKWFIRAVCQACAAASYTAQATLQDVAGEAVPPLGDQSFHWRTTKLSVDDPINKENPVTYGEPGIWFNDKGYGIANTFGPTVWVTTDDGRTWSNPYDQQVQDTCASGSGDADAVVANDGTFYTDDLCLGSPGGSSNDIFVNRSQGDPHKWTGPAYAGFDVDRQWLAVDPVHPGVAYMEYHDLEGPDINVMKTTDYGATWSCPLTGAPATGPCPITATANSNTGFIDTGQGNTTARLLVDPTNPSRLYVAYADNCALNSAASPPNSQDFNLTRIHVAVSDDAGASWKANTTTDNSPAVDANTAFGLPACSTAPPSDPTACGNTISHTFPTSAIDQAGNLYIVFSMRRCNQTQTHLWLVSSTDHGATWSKPAQVDQDGLGSNIFEWVVGGSAGRVAISWYGSPSTDYNDPNSRWSEMFAASANATSAHPTFVQSNVSGTKSIHDADICEAGTLCLATGGNRDLADFQMLAVGSDGYAQVIWTDDSGGTGYTLVGRQTSGPRLVVPANASAGTGGAVLGAATQTPFTRGLGYLAGGAWVGGGLGLAGLLLVGGGAVLWRRRRV